MNHLESYEIANIFQTFQFYFCDFTLTRGNGLKDQLPILRKGVYINVELISTSTYQAGADYSLDNARTSIIWHRYTTGARFTPPKEGVDYRVRAEIMSVEDNLVNLQIFNRCYS